VIKVDIIEELMGHEGYLTQEYRKHTDEELAKAYVQGESTLTIFGTTINLEQIQQQVDAKVDDKVEALQKVISNFAVENLELRKRVSSVESLYQALEKLVGEKTAEMELMKVWMKKQDEEEQRQKNFDEARRE
jgi:electron transfer flavoprotein alpha subunit